MGKSVDLAVSAIKDTWNFVKDNPKSVFVDFLKLTLFGFLLYAVFGIIFVLPFLASAGFDFKNLLSFVRDNMMLVFALFGLFFFVLVIISQLFVGVSYAVVADRAAKKEPGIISKTTELLV